MPLEMEHACRLMPSDMFSEFRSKDSGRARLILGKKKGASEWEVQAIRYPKEQWAESTAKASCEAHEGMFEAAVKVAEHSYGTYGIPEWSEADGELPAAAVKLLAECETRDVRVHARGLKGIEIFAAGKWNGDTYSETDLDAMVDAFPKSGISPAVKLGHDEAQKFFGQKDGHPALGWVERIYRTGRKLLADIVDIPEALYGMIRERRYRKVSAEIYWNYKKPDGAVLPRVLKAVSLLGADMPAVSGLEDLQAALMDDRGRDVRRYDREGTEIRTYELDASGSNTKGGKAMEVREYEEKISSLESQLGAEKRLREDWETRALKAESTLAQRDEDFAVKQFREVTIPQLKKEGRVLPAEEEALVVTFTSIQPGTKKYAGKDVNPRDMFVQGLKDRKPAISFREHGAGGDDDPVREGETPATAVDRTIRKFVADGEAKDYTEGKELVKSRHPQLWERYIRQT